jgi:HEAT repeat protein
MNLHQVHIVLASGLLLSGGALLAEEPRFLGKNPKQWVDQLNSEKSSARRAAAFALGKLGMETFTHRGIAPLAERLSEQESDAEVRDAAAYALGEIGQALRTDPERSAATWKAIGWSILQALADQDARVRRSAAYAAGGFGKTAASARDPLRKALHDPTPSVRQNAAWALGQLVKEDAAETLRELSKLFADSDSRVRRDAAAAVGEIGRLRGAKEEFLPNPAVAGLLGMLKSERDATIRKVALDALVNTVTTKDKAAAEGLRPFLDDKDPDLVRGAALALGNIGGAEAAEAVRFLRQALTNDEALTRIQASAALVNVGESAEPAVPDLTSALDDKVPEVRRNAALALGRIGPKARDAVPTLAKHLHPEEKSAEVRKYAAEALAQMSGDDLVPVVPDLIAAIQNDKSPAVRHRSVWALMNLHDLEAVHAVGPLTAVLAERSTDEQVMVRYEAARCLGLRLRSKAPKEAVDVLLEMLNDKRLKVYEGSGADVTGNSVEGAKGGATVAVNLGGDARFMAAQALARVAPSRASRPDVHKALEAPEVLELLKAATQSSDEIVRNAANEALRFIRGKK